MSDHSDLAQVDLSTAESGQQLFLIDLIELMREKGATDLHLTADSPPMLRLDSELFPVGSSSLAGDKVRQLVYGIMTEGQVHMFEKDMEVDFSFEISGYGRFRANVYTQKGRVAGAFRAIPERAFSLAELGLPHSMEAVAEVPNGLVLVTGATGSGKSTTLAALIDRIAERRRCHIVTIEDPIEYVHTHKKAIVNQREVRADTHSFARAMKSVLRQDPDVVLLGEMRDLETIELALTVAETGHLTFATLHTNSCVQTMNRIVSVFPSAQQAQVRAQLSFVLQCVLCQHLLPRKGRGGLALAYEIMIPNAAVRNLIREGKIHQIYSLMQAGQQASQMRTMNQTLLELVASDEISSEAAMGRTTEARELLEMFKRQGIRTDRFGEVESED
jgi:twitching motility protein PilT